MEELARTSEMNFLSRMFGVFFSPQKTMESINHKPGWVVPLIVILLATVILSVISMPVTIPYQLEKQRTAMEERGMSDEEIDQALEMSAKITKFAIPAGGLIMGGIFLVIIALVVWFVGNIILGGETNFARVFSVFLYSSFISLFGGIIKLPIIFSRQTPDVHFSIASFFNPDSLNKWLYSFLKTIELFQIWQFIVLAIGFAVIYKFSMKKAGWAMFFLFIVYSGVMTVLFGLS